MKWKTNSSSFWHVLHVSKLTWRMHYCTVQYIAGCTSCVCVRVYTCARFRIFAFVLRPPGSLNVCLPEWNVSLISPLLLQGGGGGLYSVIVASLWPLLSPWRTWEHTCHSYTKAFKRLILRLFHYYCRAFCFVFAFLLRTALWNCGWRVTNAPVKSIAERAFDWLIVGDGLACGGVDQNNEHLHVWGGYSEQRFPLVKDLPSKTREELAGNKTTAEAVVLKYSSYFRRRPWGWCIGIRKVESWRRLILDLCLESKKN